MRRFNIQTYGDDFFAGRSKSGEQFLLGLLCPNIVLFRFNAFGTVVGKESRPWQHSAARHQGIYQIYEPVFRELLSLQMSDWRTELGFIEQTIEIELFYDGEEGVGIQLPESNECACVFWWGNEYWMNEQGEVEST
jgi:hypothetical protein